MTEELDENDLLVNKDSDNINRIKASQINHSVSTEELHYGRNIFNFSNVKSNT